MGTYEKTKKNHQDRENKQKNKNIVRKENESKKNSVIPFQPLTNNFFERKHESDPNTKSYANCQQIRNFVHEHKQ